MHEPDEAQHWRLRVPAGQDLRQQEQHQRHPISAAMTVELDQQTNQPTSNRSRSLLKKGNYVTTTKSAKLTQKNPNHSSSITHSTIIKKE